MESERVPSKLINFSALKIKEIKKRIYLHL